VEAQIDEPVSSMVEGPMKPSRKKRLPPRTWPPADALAAAEDQLRRMQHWLAYSKLDGELWDLLTLGAISAYAAIEDAGDEASEELRRLFEDVMKSFRAQTSNFRDVQFLQSTRSARRGNPSLFQPHD
jgi:hypothetical protein